MTKTDSSQQHSNSKVLSDQLDIWSSILNQKSKYEASQSKTSPYIHPLVKKSESFLSEKSLEICTESLGSESGSDGFSSSYKSSSSEGNSSEDDEKLKETVNMVVKKPRCFPPPLSSLTSQTQQLQMKPHRDNGRLFMFLQVASVPSQNIFFSKRQNGRLILTFADEQEEESVDEFVKDECVIEKTQLSGLEIMVHKEIVLFDKNQKWVERFKRETSFEDVRVVQIHKHGSWPRILNQQNNLSFMKENGNRSNKDVAYGNIHQGSKETRQQLLVLRGKNGDFLIHSLKCYKDSTFQIQIPRPIKLIE
ncbi:protein FAF-like, chloroplastic [Vicia villosa]|uniref:protein FAF-like, chloroplastic n=1 Tax=Vicia villosa TaxID=3911 RepID=UPI00273C9337|nr:protein FAF-like, chloroplastic [Vicia villosa]